MSPDKIKALAQVLWTYHRTRSVLSKSDLILGLGSYDIRVAEYCAQLFHDGLAPLIVFTGKDGNWTKGLWEKTEAETFKDIAAGKGVPPDLVLTENLATNIGENLSFTRELLEREKIQARKIILVTKPNTLRRTLATTLIKWPQAEFLFSSPVFELSDQITEQLNLEDILHEMVGDLQRIKIYPELGFQAEQEIPEEAENAFHQLIELGFTKHLMKH